jgi:hypothetical protein
MLDDIQEVGGAIGGAAIVVVVLIGIVQVFPEYRSAIAGLAVVFAAAVAILLSRPL